LSLFFSMFLRHPRTLLLLLLLTAGRKGIKPDWSLKILIIVGHQSQTELHEVLTQRHCSILSIKFVILKIAQIYIRPNRVL
jgi:hypothetical protein